ncbi:hypothetical protein C7S15_7497 [Burkholderia cepacia]|nr:hypothetical protein [Burkholderia cepacia]
MGLPRSYCVNYYSLVTICLDFSIRGKLFKRFLCYRNERN